MTFHDQPTSMQDLAFPRDRQARIDTGSIPTAIELVLPYPPSVNGYWRHTMIQGKPRVLISAEGRKYRTQVHHAVLLHTPGHRKAPAGRLVVHITAHAPDRRARDLDNINKGLLDALVHAGVMADDSLIDRLTVERGSIVQGGCVRVRIGGVQ